MPLFCESEFSWVMSSQCSSTIFSNFLGLFPYPCDPPWRMFHQRTHGARGNCVQLICLILGPLTLHGMGIVQARLRSFTLVTIWLSMTKTYLKGIS